MVNDFLVTSIYVRHFLQITPAAKYLLLQLNIYTYSNNYSV